MNVLQQAFASKAADDEILAISMGISLTDAANYGQFPQTPETRSTTKNDEMTDEQD